MFRREKSQINTKKRNIDIKKVNSLLYENNMFYNTPVTPELKKNYEEMTEERLTDDTKTMMMPTNVFLDDIISKYKSTELDILIDRLKLWKKDAPLVQRSKFALLCTLKEKLTGISSEQEIYDACELILTLNPRFSELYRSFDKDEC